MLLHENEEAEQGLIEPSKQGWSVKPLFCASYRFSPSV